MYFLVPIMFMSISFLAANVAMAAVTNGELVDLARPVLDAVMGGQYAYAAALALVLGVALLRRFGGAKWPILASKKAAPYLVLAASFGAAMATSLGAGAGFSWPLVWASFKVAAGAGYGYALLKPLLEKIPYVGALFSTKARAEAARAAGQAAVGVNPSKGTGVGFTDVK